MQFEVNVAPVGAWTVVAVAGGSGVATAPRPRKGALAPAGRGHPPVGLAPEADGHHRMVLDLEAVDFLDSTGLGVLIGVLRRINTVGGALRLVCSTPRILDLFTLTGLDRVFDLRASVDDATSGETVGEGADTSGVPGGAA